MKYSQKAIFLDRDGIINIDRAYVYQFIDIEWVPGIVDLIKLINQRGYKAIVLTNQSGVSLGKYQESDILTLHRQMDDYLKKEGAVINDWYYCTEYDSPRRKPKPGMMIEASIKYQIDLNQSFMIGDKVSDVLEIDGPETLLLKGNYPLEAIDLQKPVTVFSSLWEIIEYLKKKI